MSTVNVKSSSYFWGSASQTSVCLRLTGGLVKHRGSDAVGLCGGLRTYLSTKSKGMPMLLVCGPHLESHCSSFKKLWGGGGE